MKGERLRLIFKERLFSGEPKYWLKTSWSMLISSSFLVVQPKTISKLHYQQCSKSHHPGLMFPYHHHHPALHILYFTVSSNDNPWLGQMTDILSPISMYCLSRHRHQYCLLWTDYFSHSWYHALLGPQNYRVPPEQVLKTHQVQWESYILYANSNLFNLFGDLPGNLHWLRFLVNTDYHLFHRPLSEFIQYPLIIFNLITNINWDLPVQIRP